MYCPSQTLLQWQIFFQQAWKVHRTKAQEISTGRWRALVLSESRSISMLLECCHPLICPLHFTFIHFKSTDMCLPVDWLWAIFSCAELVPLQCLGYVNGKIKHFFTRKSALPGLLPFLWWLFVAVTQQIWHNSWHNLHTEAFVAVVDDCCLDWHWSFHCVGVPCVWENSALQ